jgi:hypothetical protein
MRAAWRPLVAPLVVAVLLLGACTRKAADKSPEAAAPAPVATEVPEAAAPVVAAAANEADVTRYPDEAPIDHVLATTHVFASSARTQASATAGTVVGSLKAETDVDEIAERQGFALVYFIDPKDQSRKLLGWVSKVDFAVPPAAVGVRPLADGGAAPAPPPATGPATVPAPPATAPQRTLDVRQEHGACPGGYSRCGAMCRLQCGSSADCGGTARCFHGLCLGAGSAPCAH